MKTEPSVSDRFFEIDSAVVEQLGSRVVDSVMADLRNRDLSIKQVAERNGMSMGYVVQVARFHKVDPITLRAIA